MPINYYHKVTYDSPSGDGNPWQINPAKILQIGTTFGFRPEYNYPPIPHHGVHSTVNYDVPMAIGLKRTKPNSKFYVQVSGKVTNGTWWGDYEYDTSSSSKTYWEWGYEGSKNFRRIFWNGEEVYRQEKTPGNYWAQYGHCPEMNDPDAGCIFPVPDWVADTINGENEIEGDVIDTSDYEYQTGARKAGMPGQGAFKREVRRRYKQKLAPSSALGRPDIIIWASSSYTNTSGPYGNFVEFIGGPLIGDEDMTYFEDNFELSGYVQPTESQISTNNYAYFGVGFKNFGSNTGAVHLGQNGDYFNIMSMRAYEVDDDESTFIMKPDDAEFELTEGAPPTNEPVRGYGIPNHYWDSNEMFSRGIRCLIPNHTKPGEWAAFGEGYMTSDGGATGGSADGADVNEGYMAGMITQDNGNSWNELSGINGSTPYVSRTAIDTGNTSYIYATTYPNHPVVFDWATNGSTTNPVWIMVGREVWGNSYSNTNSTYNGTSGGNLTIYRTTTPNLQFWEKLDVVPRKFGGGKADQNQYLKSVCYSDGYFVFGSNKGYTIRSSNVATASANNITFDSWEWCNYEKTWPVPVYCLTSDDGGSNIVAGGYHLAYSTDGGNTWDNADDDSRADWFVPQPHGSGKNYNTRAMVWNITYVGDTEVYVNGVAKGPGVWIACGYKRKYKGNKNPDDSATTLYPLYAYSENMINWHEIDVENDTNLPYNGWYNPSWTPYSGNAGGYTCFPNSVRERITYCKDIKRLVTWANAGPGPSQHVDENGRIIDHHNGNETSGGYRGYGFHPGDDGWDSSKASLWISDGMSLTDWIQVSSGTPFIGAYYSGTDNAPTTATIFKDGKYRPQAPPYTGRTGTPNVFQFPGDGYMNGRYMVGSAAGSVYNNACGRVAYINLSE